MGLDGVENLRANLESGVRVQIIREQTNPSIESIKSRNLAENV